MTPAPTRTAVAILVTRLPALARQVRGIPAAEIPAKGAGLATGTGTAALATARNHRIQGSPVTVRWTVGLLALRAGYLTWTRHASTTTLADRFSKKRHTPHH